MSESHFVSLSSALIGPRPHTQLHKLNSDLANTAEKQSSLKAAKVYADISDQAWDLQGTFSSLQSAEHLQKFYQQQRLFLETYRASLESIRQDLHTFTGLSFSASSLIPGEREGVNLVRDGVLRIAERLVCTLNTYDENYGYLFGGAQIDQKPINPLLLNELRANVRDAKGVKLSLGDVQAYFVNGRRTQDQSPLIIYADSDQICTLPLRANDFQEMICVVYDFLSLPPSPTQEQVQHFHQAMDEPMSKIIDAFAKIAGDLNAFEAQEVVLGKRAEHSANFRDQQLDVDSVEAAIAFQDASQALKAFLNYLVFLVSSSRQFHELTARVMT